MRPRSPLRQRQEGLDEQNRHLNSLIEVATYVPTAAPGPEPQSVGSSWAPLPSPAAVRSVPSAWASPPCRPSCRPPPRWPRSPPSHRGCDAFESWGSRTLEPRATIYREFRCGHRSHGLQGVFEVCVDESRASDTSFQAVGTATKKYKRINKVRGKQTHTNTITKPSKTRKKVDEHHMHPSQNHTTSVVERPGITGRLPPVGVMLRSVLGALLGESPPRLTASRGPSVAKGLRLSKEKI